jgi:ribosomal-protein-alanine N-acetyltransferase
MRVIALAWLMQLGYPSPELCDGVVRLRRWEHRDLHCVRLAATDKRIPQGTSVPAVYTDQEGMAFIERQRHRQEGSEGLSLAIEPVATSRASGLVAALLRPQPGVVGLGYWVVPPERGRQLARHAIGLLSRWLLTEGPIVRVEALVAPDNHPSRRSVEACGFSREGRLRSYLGDHQDVLVYSLVRSDLLHREPGRRPEEPESVLDLG